MNLTIKTKYVYIFDTNFNKWVLSLFDKSINLCKVFLEATFSHKKTLDTE